MRNPDTLPTTPVLHSCRQSRGRRIDVELAHPVVTARERDEFTTQLLGQLSREKYQDTVDTLTAPPTRHSTRPEFTATLSAAADVFTSLGYTVTRQPFSIPGGGDTVNCIADRRGSSSGERGLTLITAHLDSVNRGGAALPAPGADDNASGSAGVLELARVLSTETWSGDLRLILFGGEEQGLLGSIHHVRQLDPHDRARITAVINMDMIARRNTADPGVMVEGGEPSRDLIDELVVAAATWTDLAVTTSLNPFASDHVPFIDAGLPAVLTIEADDSANTDVHTEHDVVAKLDPDLAIEILRMNLAVAAGHLR
ncbi:MULTISPECIES: M28 family metallopeptidase [unclassified Gordonia (in: high G+C Gram-positive bacteria)]|uniref:M28 family metallopeptidase n=1 Tax=unclassified Gordonia (in: high G+C Gram-positive bacteria) TaxID=2657482 RepID=UPI001F0E7177|nr:M28 family metallopeptidase [Gordonia sp. ABSL49_1]MCH5642622.1 M28 family metallopeptidase [Gordonia sp. ABSL49_1]